MADRSVRVEIRGGRELVRALKQTDRELPKALRKRFRDIAETVAGRTRSKMPAISGTAQFAVRPRASQTGASIFLNDSKAPYLPWLDFGGAVGRNDSIRREIIPGGRYLYPSIAESREDIGNAADDAIREVAKDAGFETRGDAA